MHNVFISYHHKNDQFYKDEILKMNKISSIFNDYSVDTGDIDENLPDERIRQIIRDDYLKDSSVTILLVGTETRKRKHIDWEIYSSMYNGVKNKKSGILVINLPSTNCYNFSTSHENEKQVVHPEYSNWFKLSSRADYENQFSCMPDRITDNLINDNVKISVLPWNKIDNNPNVLKFLIDATYNDRIACDYDLSRPMRRNNS